MLDQGVLGIKHVKHLSDLRAMFLSTTSRNTANDLIQFLCDILFTVKNITKCSTFMTGSLWLEKAQDWDQNKR